MPTLSLSPLSIPRPGGITQRAALSIPQRPSRMGCFVLAHTGRGQGRTALGDMWLLPRVAAPHLMGQSAGTARCQQLCRHPAKPTRKFPQRFPVRRCWMFPSAPLSQPPASPWAHAGSCSALSPAGARCQAGSVLGAGPSARRGGGELFSTGSSCCLAAPRDTGSSLAPPEPRPQQSCLCLRAPAVSIRTVSSPGRSRSPRPRTHVLCANSCCCSRQCPASPDPCPAVPAAHSGPCSPPSEGMPRHGSWVGMTDQIVPDVNLG